MATIFRDIPRDAETVATVRRGCTERRFHATCREAACRRAGRCRGPWRPAPDDDKLVLPRCLRLRTDMLDATLADAETALIDLRLIVAEARRVPDPQYTAEFAAFDPGDVTPPWET